MSIPKTEHMILAVSAAGLPAAIQRGPSGVYAMPVSDCIETLDRAGAYFGPRGPLEDDPRFRQVIPYVLIRCQGKFLTYTRPAGIEETRLATKSSIGFGGHVDITDLVLTTVNEDMKIEVPLSPKLDLDAIIATAAYREIAEEIGGGPDGGPIDPTNQTVLGLLVDNSPGVGMVHIGVVQVWDIDDIGIQAQPDEVTEVSFKTLDELMAQRNTLELWSALALDHIARTQSLLTPPPEDVLTEDVVTPETQLADAAEHGDATTPARTRSRSKAPAE